MYLSETSCHNSVPCVQVYLVAGGQNTLTSSTELLVQGGARVTASELCPSTTPSSQQVQHLVLPSTCYTILCIAGGYNYKTGVTYDTILKFDPISLVWTEVGRLRQARTMHAASVARLQDIKQYCQQG